MYFTYSQTDGPTDRRTDHRLVGVVESPVGNPSGAGVRFWTCRGQKNGCKGFYLLRLPKTGFFLAFLVLTSHVHLCFFFSTFGEVWCSVVLCADMLCDVDWCGMVVWWCGVQCAVV